MRIALRRRAQRKGSEWTLPALTPKTMRVPVTGSKRSTVSVLRGRGFSNAQRKFTHSLRSWIATRFCPSPHGEACTSFTPPGAMRSSMLRGLIAETASVQFSPQREVRMPT